jgi:hypothetical protein
MQKGQLQILTIADFPQNPFFKHLIKGSEFFYLQHYEKAIEEWSAAERIGYFEPINLRVRQTLVSRAETLPFILFLYTIYSNKLTGIGVVKNGDITKKMYFKKGFLTFAVGSQAKERIGKFLAKKEGFTEEELDKLAKEAKSQGKRLGSYLVEKQIISLKTLKEILTLQILEIVSEVFVWRKSYFLFLQREINEETVVHYDPLKIALIAARRKVTFEYFRKQIPNNKVIFRLSPYIESKKEKIMTQLDANERFIFSLIDGRRNIDQLIKFSGGEEISVINILYRFLKIGWIRKSREIIEYEDEEFVDFAKVIEVLFDIYQIIRQTIFKELGAKTKEIVNKARNSLSSDYQKVFLNLNLEDMKMDGNIILKNIATYFPEPENRLIFIDAFEEFYIKIMQEAKRFLGRRIIEEIVQEIQKVKENIGIFYVPTSVRDKLLKVFDVVIKTFC